MEELSLKLSSSRTVETARKQPASGTQALSTLPECPHLPHGNHQLPINSQPPFSLQLPLAKLNLRPHRQVAQPKLKFPESSTWYQTYVQTQPIFPTDLWKLSIFLSLKFRWVLLFFLITVYMMCVCVCVCGGVNAMVNMWRSKDFVD